ncbi:MAG TPA: 16S rRNA (uracil(1498)-N(3))-methyltransferase [Phycisphaerales bacterium]|nr:16S rRNA (uracil(1498)-N(3))-methyltransferase [Phycisphaerales bacterium]
MIRSFCNTIQAGEVMLERSEAHHLVSVMRVAVGERIEIFDGKGGLGQAVITKVTRRDVTLEVEKVETFPMRDSGRVVIATSIAKGQRFDNLITKCTELGADHIAPVVFERTVKLASGASAEEKYGKRAISACKQCGRVFLPEISRPASLADAIAALKKSYPEARLIFGSLSDGAESITELTCDGKDTVAFVGPEGGLTDAEESLLKESGALPVRLTETVLRIETAAIAMAAILCVRRDGK